MRIALVVHAFPPTARTGVEVYVEALARALAGQGAQVEVFAPRRDPERAALSQTREEREGYAVTWLALDPREEDEDRRRAHPGAAAAFARFLEREQPDVVHFQHFLGLGVELVDVARERERPTLFTAHDHFALSNEYTLLAPDLSPLDPSDHEAQVRCRLARGVLDRGLEAHDGFLVSGQGAAELEQELSAVLHGELPASTELAPRVTRLRAELATRLETLSRVDHLEAPTEYLAARIAADGREVRVRAQGIELEPLAGLEPPHLPGGEPMRVLYLGGYYEHKGVHLLLEACAGLEDHVQLRLRGCAGTSDYAGRLRERARAAGAELGGPFERAELPGLLGGADLLVVPSLWSENAPFVIREAFAAGRPVIASDTPALRESVRHGEDGLLVPAGDVSALRAALMECATDRRRFAGLLEGVRPPRSIAEDAAELFELYAELADRATLAAERRRRRLPAHLHAFSARHARLSRLPTQELAERCLQGLARLGRTTSGVSPPAAPLPGGERLRERLAEAERAIEWRRTVAQDRERALAHLEEQLEQSRALELDLRRRAEWLEDLLARRDEHLAWKAETSAALERALESSRAGARGPRRGAGLARGRAHDPGARGRLVRRRAARARRGAGLDARGDGRPRGSRARARGTAGGPARSHGRGAGRADRGARPRRGPWARADAGARRA